MTKSLTKAEKAANKKVKQQKAKSTTSRTVAQPKPGDQPPAFEPAAADDPVNKCDDCAFEFGSCEGVPKFASDFKEGLTGPAADVVVECVGFLPVDKMLTAEELAARDNPPGDHGDDDNPPNEPGGNQGEEEPELVHADEIEGATEEGKAEDMAVIREDLPARPDPKRFQADETDYGKCPSCEVPLKRTAYNRYRDAIRCTNPRCRAYRSVVRDISTGVK